MNLFPEKTPRSRREIFYCGEPVVTKYPIIVIISSMGVGEVAVAHKSPAGGDVSLYKPQRV